MIACTEVTVEIGGRALLSEVSLSLEGGELLALVGPNGAGKSTLLHVLAGDRRPMRGAVWVLGRPISAWRLDELAKVRAVLPQSESLAFPFTALEVVLLGRAPYVRFAETAHDIRIARRALSEVGLEGCADRLYTTLSGGERQRVQFARVLAQLEGPDPKSPRALLLDEPTASLDLAHQHRTLALGQRLARGGACVLAVLHDLNLAARYADRIAVLSGGRLASLGRPDEVLTESLLRSVFGVRASILPDPEHAGRVLVAALGPTGTSTGRSGGSSRTASTTPTTSPGPTTDARASSR